jgi:carbamoyltransferase
MTHAGLGRAYSDREIRAALARAGAAVAYRPSANIAGEAAQWIAEGRIVGWFQGRSEFGPRALGSRSILADPRCPEMKDKLNRKVKFREPFRPFAPAVLEECVSEYFETDQPSPFMLLVVPSRPVKRDQIASALHVDGTARLQTINAGSNGIFYELVSAFYRQTGVPMVINTSFNVAGQPIVESPEDALFTLTHSQIDALAIGQYLVWRNQPSSAFLSDAAHSPRVESL